MAAAPLLEEAARIFEALGLREDWARTEYNLGNVCCELAERGLRRCGRRRSYIT
jgi:hypothetical protein